MQTLSSIKKDSWLAWSLKGILVLGFIVMVGRMVELQIIKGNYFHSLAEENRVRRVPILAPRGEIIARGGEILVGNKDGKRIYPLHDEFAHASGYLGSVSETEIGKVDPKCPEKGPLLSTTLVGRSGLEQQYSCDLRGFDGEELIEVDTFGNKIRTLGQREPVAGKKLKTTIDYGLQNKVAQAFKTDKLRKGAVVASDLQGQILAFYSAPGFDPDNVSNLLNDPNLPLFNRAIGGGFHPGSVFKMVTSVAALEDKKVTPDFYYEDPGVITINKFSYANWLFTKYARREGKINLERALARSTDTFYYKLGEFIGVESLASWARRFGYGKQTNIDIPGEAAGLIPDPDWKQEVKKENWFLGNTYHMAIGQGDVAATPLQVNMATVALANGGKLCKPYFVIGSAPECKPIGIAPKTLEEVEKGMIGACAPGGTANPFFNFEPKVACKTGTAETEDEKKTHAWFTVWGPVTASESTMPQIALTVLVEKGGEGSEVAAPIAREIFNYWFYDRNP